MAKIREQKRRRKTHEKVDLNAPLPSPGASINPSSDWWENFPTRVSGYTPDSLFKVSRKTFEYICGLVEEEMMTGPNCSDLRLEYSTLNDRVAIALTRLSTGESLGAVGDLFRISITTVSLITWRFVEAIEKKGFHHLHWPKTEEQITEIKSKFERIKGLPNCCGAIDTINILFCLSSDHLSSKIWRNSENNACMILQAVVDPDMRFLDIIAGLPGSLCEPDVLCEWSLFNLCEEGKRLNGKKLKLADYKEEIGEYIVGSGGFPLLPWLITPYNQEKKLCDVKENFNKRHYETLKVAKMAFERLKETWQIIKGVLWTPDKHKLPRIIYACCVLHNIMIDQNDGFIMQDESFLQSNDNSPQVHQQKCKFLDKTASVQRDNLALYLSSKLPPFSSNGIESVTRFVELTDFQPPTDTTVVVRGKALPSKKGKSVARAVGHSIRAEVEATHAKNASKNKAKRLADPVDSIQEELLKDVDQTIMKDQAEKLSEKSVEDQSDATNTHPNPRQQTLQTILRQLADHEKLMKNLSAMLESRKVMHESIKADLETIKTALLEHENMMYLLDLFIRGEDKRLSKQAQKINKDLVKHTESIGTRLDKIETQMAYLIMSQDKMFEQLATHFLNAPNKGKMIVDPEQQSTEVASMSAGTQTTDIPLEQDRLAEEERITESQSPDPVLAEEVRMVGNQTTDPAEEEKFTRGKLFLDGMIKPTTSPSVSLSMGGVPTPDYDTYRTDEVVQQQQNPCRPLNVVPQPAATNTHQDPIQQTLQTILRKLADHEKLLKDLSALFESRKEMDESIKAGVETIETAFLEHKNKMCLLDLFKRGEDKRLSKQFQKIDEDIVKYTESIETKLDKIETQMAYLKDKISEQLATHFLNAPNKGKMIVDPEQQSTEVASMSAGTHTTDIPLEQDRLPEERIAESQSPDPVLAEEMKTAGNQTTDLAEEEKFTCGKLFLDGMIKPTTSPSVSLSTGGVPTPNYDTDRTDEVVQQQQNLCSRPLNVVPQPAATNTHQDPIQQTILRKLADREKLLKDLSAMLESRKVMDESIKAVVETIKTAFLEQKNKMYLLDLFIRGEDKRRSKQVQKIDEDLVKHIESIETKLDKIETQMAYLIMSQDKLSEHLVTHFLNAANKKKMIVDPVHL